MNRRGFIGGLVAAMVSLFVGKRAEVEQEPIVTQLVLRKPQGPSRLPSDQEQLITVWLAAAESSLRASLSVGGGARCTSAASLVTTGMKDGWSTKAIDWTKPWRVVFEGGTENATSDINESIWKVNRVK